MGDLCGHWWTVYGVLCPLIVVIFFFNFMQCISNLEEAVVEKPSMFLDSHHIMPNIQNNNLVGR